MFSRKFQGNFSGMYNRMGSFTKYATGIFKTLAGSLTGTLIKRKFNGNLDWKFNKNFDGKGVNE